MAKPPFMKASFSFNGKIKEFPGLCIDRCNADADICLISHCHKDHLNGLLNKSTSGKIYCSSLTKKLILQDPKYRSLKLIIEPLSVNEIHNFQLRKIDISVTLIPSYHCPGSVMFLVERGNKSILYTGDVRGEKWWLAQLEENAILAKYLKGNGILNTIYLDTTFSYRGMRIIEFPSNHDSIDLLTKIILCYPLDDPDVQFFFKDFTSGFEEIWQIITEKFGERIHLNEDLRNRIKCLESELLYSLSMNYTNGGSHAKYTCKFHACSSSASCRDCCKFSISVKRCIDFNAFDYTTSFFPISLEKLCPEELENHLTLVDRTENGHLIFSFRGSSWLLNKHSNELLPCTVKFPFSGHSSYSECRNIVSLFRPLEVYPCTESTKTWENGFTMAKYFGDLCRNGEQQTYDRIKEKEYGRQLALISKLPIKVINAWNIEECIDLIRYCEPLENLNSTNLTSNKLLRLTNLSRNYNDSLHYGGPPKPTLSVEKKETFANLGKLPLQELIIERKNNKYMNFFKKQQLLYFRYYKASCLQKTRDYMGSYEKELSDTTKGPKLGGLDEYNYNSSNDLCKYDELDLKNENDLILNELSNAIPLHRRKYPRSHGNSNSSVPRVLGQQLIDTLSDFHNFFNASCDIEVFDDANYSSKKRKSNCAENFNQMGSTVMPLYINGNQNDSFKKRPTETYTKNVIFKSSAVLNLDNITRSCYQLSQNPTFWCGMSLNSFQITSVNKAFTSQDIPEWNSNT